MTRNEATKLCREEMDKWSLSDWHIRLSPNDKCLGLCSYKDKAIILSVYHLDIHPDPEILNTIRHEIAHALCPGAGHNEIWQQRAREIGCTSVAPCSHLSFSPEIIDAIRSGADVEVTYETEIIHRPKYQITRLQDKCEICSKVAKQVREFTIQGKDDAPDRKFMVLECGHTIFKLIPKGTPFHKLVSNWWREEVAKCQHEWELNQCKHCGEYKLFPFQVDGARFLEAALIVNNGAGLFDEMGLGKTVQGLADLYFHAEERTPYIAVVKSAIKFQWFKEIVRFCGPMMAPQIIETSNDFLIPQVKGYIISYDMLVNKERRSKSGKTIKQGFDVQRLIDLNPKVIFLDECQLIKNPDASRTQEVRKLCKGRKVIALSGTPWKNRGSEFFTVLNMLAPTKFPSYQGFIDRWVDTYFDGRYNKQAGIRRVEQFRAYVKDIVIRREVSEVMKEMPDVNRTLFFTELKDFEQKELDNELTKFVQWYQDAEANDELNSFSAEGNILAKMARMRHLTGLAKIPATLAFVQDFIESTGGKITVFVHHKDVGNLLIDELKKLLDVPVFKLTAEEDSETRFRIQEEFNATESCALVASTLASGEGINLQSCGNAILHERQWNPQNEDQAAPGRFRRIGSKFEHVNVTFITAAGTIDEVLAGIVERKRAFFHSSMNKGAAVTWNQGELAKELAEGLVKMYKERNKK